MIAEGSAGVERPCSHCGLPAPDDGSGAPLAFCCSGCATAFTLLRDAGLDRYYELRDRLGTATSARPVTDQVSAGAYAHFDDEAYLAEHGHRGGCADLHVSGLHCAACVWVIDRLPAVLDGVEVSRVDFGTGRLHLEWDPERIRLSEIARFLHRIGYPTHAFDAAASAERARQRRQDLIRLAVAGACAGNVMLASLSLYAGDFSGMTRDFQRLFELLALALTIPAVTYGAWPFYRGAWSGLRVGRLHMDLPISLGLVIGFVASLVAALGGPGHVYFDSVTMLVFLLLLGRFVQQRGQDWAISRGALLHLLLPGTAVKMGDEGWVEVSSGLLGPGDRVRVRPGERFSADGRIVRGQSAIDLSKITGESVPVPVGEGDEVLAGTTNLEDEVEVEVVAAGARTRLGQLVARIDGAGQTRAHVVELADTIAGWFVAAVIGLAAVGGIGWSFIDPSRALDVTVALLVVSCPCALGLATPSALAVARGRAARRGILMANTAALERLARVRHVVFDKTGTLTEGQMRVADVRAFGTELDAKATAELAGLLMAAEQGATHPVGRALRAWAIVRRDPAPGSTSQVLEVAGRGVESRVDGRRVRVGRPGWISAWAPEVEAAVEAFVAEGLTPVLVEVEGRVVAGIGVGDRIRSGMRPFLDRLGHMGIEVRLRSGDDARVVEQVADSLGITDALGRCSPEDKAEEVAGRGDVAMVGDGVNDAPALRSAAVGVAVGGGAEAALRVADVHLERPEDIAALLDGARATMGTVRRNLSFSLAYNGLFASLALAGLINPLAAAVLMPISSLTVLGSSVFGRSF